MASSISIHKTSNKLHVNSDSYELSKIVGVQVKELAWKDHIIRSVMLGVVSSSLLFIFLPSENQEYGLAFSTFLPVVGFSIGMVLAFLVSSKYEFRIEFDHADDTGVQWFT
ncbi:MAG: hypothetical protein V7735_25920, partial [Photobacterium frigidiphilum]|uniref:hypothetical protein n=1 Tax=Photobacterium frigidiphilum TaxID=264736 RepID=UPI0030036419